MEIAFNSVAIHSLTAELGSLSLYKALCGVWLGVNESWNRGLFLGGLGCLCEVKMWVSLAVKRGGGESNVWKMSRWLK